MERAPAIRLRLFGLAARGIKYDLERMTAAVERCGSPQLAYPSFHVAGTNGKGSVCAYLESALRSCGFRTGLFTSPHIVRFEERFMVDGRPIDESAWLEAYDDLQPVIEEFHLTFFEATTLIAFEIFRRQKVDWAVFETGLGGRLDATNLVAPKVSVISRIAMDHMDYLGTDLASIAAEKLGIVKKQVTLVMAKPENEEIASLVKRRCGDVGTSFRLVSDSDASDCAVSPQGASFRWKNNRYAITLRGEYQVVNALLALNALEAAGIGEYRPIAQGLERTRLPGRFQIETVRGRTVVFDVGHNPDAARSFCNDLQRVFSGKTICFVLGIMKDKDIAGMTPHYAAAAHRLIFTAPATDRAARPEDIKKSVPVDYKGECSMTSTVALAIDEAFNMPEEVICVAGSFFTVGEAMTFLQFDPYGDVAYVTQ